MKLKSIDASIKVLEQIHLIHLDFEDPDAAYSEDGEWVETELDYVGFVNFQFSMIPQNNNEPWIPMLSDAILYNYKGECMGELNFDLISINLNFQ